MSALFVGHTYTDITFLTQYMPTGDEKTCAEDFAIGVGGNAVVASFLSAEFGIRTDLVTQVAPDRLGDVFLQRAAKMGVRIYPIPVKRSSASLIIPNETKRAIVRCRDDDYPLEIPEIDISLYDALHLDGHLKEIPITLAKKAKENGVLVSLDGGTYRENTEALLPYIDIAVVSQDFAKKLNLSAQETLEYLSKKGVVLPAITLGEKGLLYKEDGCIKEIKALDVEKEKIIDTTGAGDIFHGAYLASYLKGFGQSWEEHFKFARVASSLSIQKLGAEAGIPHLSETVDIFNKTKHLP